MKTSRPRTFSINSTLISPSLNLPTYARPSGVCRLRAISNANIGFALPANRASVSPVELTDHRVITRPSDALIFVAGWKDPNLGNGGAGPLHSHRSPRPAPKLVPEYGDSSRLKGCG